MSGTPTAPGKFAFEITIQDSNLCTFVYADTVVVCSDHGFGGAGNTLSLSAGFTSVSLADIARGAYLNPLVLEPVQPAHGCNEPLLRGGIHAVRIAEVEDRITLAVELDALELAGKEPAVPLARRNRLHLAPLARAEHHDVAGQFLRLDAETVTQPRADARPAEVHVAGVHENLPRRVVERIRGHRFHEAEVVANSREMRKQLGKFRIDGELSFASIQAANTSGYGVNPGSAIRYAFSLSHDRVREYLFGTLQYEASQQNTDILVQKAAELGMKFGYAWKLKDW